MVIEPETLRCGEVHEPDVVTMRDICNYGSCKQLRTPGSEWCLWHRRSCGLPSLDVRSIGQTP
jgi:hypothetical protein